MKQYYLKDRNRVKGPFMLDDLKYQNINVNTEVKIDEGNWEPIANNMDLNFLIKMASGHQPTNHNERKQTVQKSDKISSVNASARNRLIILFAIILMGISFAFVFFALGNAD